MSAATSILFGLLSAATWGAGDFCGGLASRRAHTFAVVAVSQMIGGSLLVVLALLFREPWPAPVDLGWGALAGVIGNIGLLALYRGLATGQMGVVAPLSAVLSAALPVVVAVWAEGLPELLTLAGFGVALAGVWLLSRPEGGAPFRLDSLGLPLAAGLGFGLFFVLIDRVGPGALFWPLVAARAASLTMMTVVLLARRPVALPERGRLPLIALSGALDAGGNAFFALAAQTGRLDIAAVLASLYPASTVLLAGLVLKERLTRVQIAGVLAALAAIVLIAV